MFISGGSFSGTYIIMVKTPDKKVSEFIVPTDAKVFLLIKIIKNGMAYPTYSSSNIR